MGETHFELRSVIERLVSHVGLEQTLAFTSTCKRYRKQRQSLIEKHVLLPCSIVDRFADAIIPKRQIVTTIDETTNLRSTVTHLTFSDWFDQPLDDVMLPLGLTHLKFGDWFNQPLDDVMLPPTLTHLTSSSG